MRKFKIRTIFKITALFLCLVMILPLAAACGEKTENPPADSNESQSLDENATSEQTEESEPETTSAPTTEPPTTTEPEPEPEPIDPSLPYYEYLDEEFKRFGFVDGDRIVADTEQALMDTFRAKGCTKTAVDLSGQDVPFQYAYKYEITAESTDFWDKAAECNFSASKKMAEGEIIAGCVYIRDAKGSNPAQAYFAIKTPTNDWGSEGNMNVNLVEAGEEWQKIYFYGEVVVDEDPASAAVFTLFLGYEPHSIEIGGLYVMRYPATSANMKATGKMPW